MKTGNPNSPQPHLPSEWHGYLRPLEALRESLLKERGNEVKGMGTRRAGGSGRLAHCISLGILSQQQDAASEVESAINRILAGRYGICEETGRPIPEARLKVVPWTRYTKEVLERKERRRIGELLAFASIIPNRRGATSRKVFAMGAGRMVWAETRVFTELSGDF